METNNNSIETVSVNQQPSPMAFKEATSSTTVNGGTTDVPGNVKKKYKGEAAADRFLKSRTHAKVPIQKFTATLTVDDFMNAIKREPKSTAIILGSTNLKGQTDFRDQLPKPHPKFHLQLILMWDRETSALNMIVKILQLDDHKPAVRFCLKTFVATESLNKVVWASGVYFGEQTQLCIIGDTAFLACTWFMDQKTFDVTNQYGALVGNIKHYLQMGGSFNLCFDLCAMTNREVMARVLEDYTMPGGRRPMFTELIDNEYRCLLEMLYMEATDVNTCLYSSDKHSYFLCHKQLLIQHSTVFREFLVIDRRHPFKDESALTYVKVNNVTTRTLRVIIYYIYEKRIHPGWVKHAVEIISGCQNLKMNTLTGELIKNLSQSEDSSPAKMQQLWIRIREYRKQADEKAKALRSKEHAIQHPGVPCDRMCENAWMLAWPMVSVLRAARHL